MSEPKPLVRRHFELKETAVTILAGERFVPIAERAIFETREVIERFIRTNPLFRDTLEPYDEPEDAPPVIKRMCDAARKAEVGPMAAVAGAIAEKALQTMIDAGARQAAVDNGGDIALFLSEPLDVGIFVPNPRFAGLGLHCEPTEEAFGICTSSRSVGHSISFGIADAATIISKNVTLADACATRLGNAVTVDDEMVIKEALDDVMGIKGVDGAMVIVGEHIAFKGSVPRLMRIGDTERAASRREFG